MHQYTITRWEIDIPYDWEYGEWERIRLYPAPVNIFVIKCTACGEEYRVYPSFVTPGTTLTWSALVFIAFVYETSPLTWRELVAKFCSPEDRIAHSTLYKAVHGLGKSLSIQGMKIREEIEKLQATYRSPEENTHPEQPPQQKSRFEHTREREASLHTIILPLSYRLTYLSYRENRFIRAFYPYQRFLKRALSGLDPPVSRLYQK